MKFKLEIECDNAAFHEDEPTAEIARILRHLADRKMHHVDTIPLPLVDYNGNVVGHCKMVKNGRRKS